MIDMMSGATARNRVTATDPLVRGRFVWPAPRMRVRGRSTVVGAALAAALVLAVAVEFATGRFPLTIPEIFEVFAGGGERIHRTVVLEWRMPRVLAGLCVGLSLGAAGSVTQSVSRNPLASPDLIGITLGASAGAVALLVLAPGPAAGVFAVPAAAFVGGLLTSLLVWALAWRGGVSTLRLVLVGVGVGALASAAITGLLAYTDTHQAAEAVGWLTGSLTGRGWHHVQPVVVTMIVGFLIVVFAHRALSALEVGDDHARSLGVRVTRSRALLWCAAVVLAAGAVAAAGPIGFVALAAPQLARLLFRLPTPPVVGGALCGALLVVLSDVLAQLLFADDSVPVGVVTAALGAPFLLALLLRIDRKVTL